MRPESSREQGGASRRETRRAQVARRVLAAVSVVLAMGFTVSRLDAQAATYGAPTRVDNIARATFLGADGIAGSAEGAATVFVRPLVSASLTLSNDFIVTPGNRVVFPHVLTNTGTATDRFVLQTVAPAGWDVTVYIDVDGDGTISDADRLAAGAVVLDRNASATLLIAVQCPASAREGFAAPVTLRATSSIDGNVAANPGNRVSVRRATSPDLLVAKTVDRAAATTGDTLLYTITVRNRGGAATDTNAVLSDPLPDGLRYVPASLRLGAIALTDAADADAGTIAGAHIAVDLGVLAPNATAEVSFRAVVSVAPGQRGSLANIATVNYGGIGAVATSATSPAAETQLSFASLTLQKDLVGADSIILGHEAQYRLRYINTSTTAGRSVVLVDTLPASLAFVSASPAPVSVDGQVISWNLGNVAPGDGGVILLTTRAISRAANGEPMVNRAVVIGHNAAAAAASAAALRIGDWTGEELEITKRAGVLDAAIGEAVPYAITVRNKGWAPLRNVVVSDELPEGTRLIEKGVFGADSIQVRGRTVYFFVSSVGANAEHAVRYAIVLASAGGAQMLRNRAFALAEGGRVRSDSAIAWVKVRGGFAMQSQTVLGKVWIDQNNDGRQDPGELGVANAQIVTADGQIITTDKEGRFSIRNVRPGTHALRLDTLGLTGGLRLARAADEVMVARTDGWTTPRVNFRLVPPSQECSCADSVAAAMLTPMSTLPAKKDVTPPSVAPLRSSEERQAEMKRAFLEGPVVRLAVPADGAVVATNRVFVRVAGEPNARVRLYDGARKIGEAVLRPDGSQDFIGVELTSGTNRLRAVMKNSFGRERWDSITVHRSGDVARMRAPDAPVVVRMEAAAATTVEVLLADEWGVPVADKPSVTIVARNVQVEGRDADQSSIGEQRQADKDGRVRLAIRAGKVVGPGDVTIQAGSARGIIAIKVLPSARALVATGVGQIGIGASPENFGALTVRGAIDEQTAMSVSFDSRRAAKDDAFAQSYDPLDEARMATYGDGSETRAPTASTQRLSARVERGYDWIAFGDVQAQPFGTGRLTSYQRALSGMSARIGAGAVVVSGFASLTSQSFTQQQLRGDGGSGPYVFGSGIRRGTDRVAIEVRDRDNAGRVIARQELMAFVDYTIDYATGALLMRRPVPSTDAYGNPIFVIATMERAGVGDRHLVGGLRAESDVARYLPALGVDSLTIGVVGVRGGKGSAAGVGADADLLGVDAQMTRGNLTTSAEILRAQGSDSSATAVRAGARWAIGEMANLNAEMLRVGSGFDRSLDPRLAAAMSEVRIGGELRLSGDSRMSLTHERQRFEQFGVERRVVRADAEQRLLGRRATQQLNFSTDEQDGSASEGASMLAGKLTMSVNSRTEVWAEAQRAMEAPGMVEVTRPNQAGLGVAYRVFSKLSVEAAHHRVWVGQDSVNYALSSLGLKSDALFGGNAHGSIERAGAARASHAAVLGWNNRVSLTKGWSAHSMFERRMGLEKANLADPVRALPFTQTERNRWSVGGGLEWLPGADKSRFSARAELHDGEDRSGYRAELAGDAPLGMDAALITYHDWSQYHRGIPGAREFSRADRSLVGVALRPTSSDVFNALAKLEWRRTLNPLGSVLSTAASDSRLIGAGDIIWAPELKTELSARYAIRWAGTAIMADEAPVSSQSHFIGVRGDRALRPKLAARIDGRLMLETTSNTTSWSVAPSLVWRADPRVELEGGWRMGPLVDRDFAANARAGLFASINFRFTENALATPAAFWRERVSRNP